VLKGLADIARSRSPTHAERLGAWRPMRNTGR
jgi:hypothetical protein